MPSNRFREAIKGKGKEILSAGKPELDEELEAKDIQFPETVSYISDVSEEEDTYQESSLIKSLEPAVSGEITFEQVQEFLSGKINQNVEELRINAIKNIINSLIDHYESSEPVVICDYKENIQYWCAAIKMAVPEKVEQNLNFLLQDKDSLSENCIISFTDRNSSVSKKDIDLYSRFNYISGNGSLIKNDSKFAKMIQVGFSIDKKTMNSFNSFISQFDYKKLDPDIDNCFELFYVINRGIENMEYSSIVHAINFANTYADIETRKQLLLNMEHLLFEINNNLDKQLAEIVIKFILKIAKDSSEKIYYIKAYRFFFQCIQNLLQGEEEDNLIGAVNFYNRIKNLADSYENSFFKYSLSEENIRQMLNNSDSADPRYAKFYLATTLQILMENNNSWRDNIPYEKFISSCMTILLSHKEDIKEVIDSVIDNEEYFSNVMIIYFDIVNTDKTTGRNDAVDLLIEKTDEFDKIVSVDIRNYMMSSFKGYILLFEEYKTRLIRANNKADFFWQYTKDVFDKLKGFNEKYFKDALDYYISTIKDSSCYTEECSKMLKLVVSNKIQINSSSLSQIVEEYEKGLSLIRPDNEESKFISSVINMKEIYNIHTSPDVIGLINFGISLEETSKRDEIRDLLQSSALNLNNISTDKYCEFIDWCLNTLLNKDEARITDIITFYKNVRTYSESGNIKYTEELLNIEKLNKIKPFMERVKPKRIQFYMLIILEYVIKKGEAWQSGQPYEEYLSGCLNSLLDNKSELEGVINSVIDNLDYFINLTVLYYSKTKSAYQYDSNNGIKLYMTNAKDKGAEWEKEARKCMLSIPEGCTMMFDIFKVELNNAENKFKFFWDYYRDVFESSDNYLKRFFSDAAEIYLDFIKSNDSYVSECVKILNRQLNSNVVLKVDTLTRVINAYESTLDVTYPGTEWDKVISKVAKLKKDNNIITNPDILGIIEFGYKLEIIEDESQVIELLKNTSINLNDIDRLRYESYINWCLPIICSKVNLLEESEKIKKVTYVNEFEQIYSKVYNKQLFMQMSSISLNDSKEKVRSIFSGMEDNMEGFGNMILLYFNQSYTEGGENDDSVRLLIETEDRQESDQRLKLRKYISSLDGGMKLIFEEFKIRLTESKDKVKFFWAYCDSCFETIINYKKEYYFEAMQYYLDSIKKSDSFSDQCFKIINLILDNKFDMPESVLINIIKGCERAIKIGKPDEAQKKVISSIQEIKYQTGVVTSPDILGLIDFGVQLERLEEADDARNLINLTTLDLQDIDIITYEKCLEWCLPKSLYCVNSWQIHAEIKKLFYTDNHGVIFFTKYLEILGEILDRDRSEGYKIFAEFIIFFFNARDQFTDEILVQVRSNITMILSRQVESRIKDIDNSIKAEISSMRNKDMLANEWTSICNKVQNNLRSTDKSFSRGFRSMFKK